MAITLGVLVLPQGLRWEDEHSWTPTGQAMDYSLTGALIVQESSKQAGRPITLVGGIRWAWLTRAELRDLADALSPVDAILTLTLHDNRQFQVRPRRDGDGPIQAYPLPVAYESGPANPNDGTRYVLERVRLMEA